MLIVPAQLKVFASLTPTDMRKSFHGLSGIIESQLGKQVENGGLFLFFNRRRDRLKVLFYTGDGKSTIAASPAPKSIFRPPAAKRKKRYATFRFDNR